MKKAFLFPLLAFLITQGMTAQVKLGDNPQSIDPASLFELESTNQVLVITRVSSAELQAINPSMGALAYNTDEKCLFYHNGEVWVNLCDALGRAFTTEAIQNEFPTIVITPLEESINFEVGEIRSENIVDFSIGSQDIQNNSINSEKLADASVGAAELQDNAVTGRNLDFVDITLSDFVNDVPFLVQGNLVAAAIFYDNTASGLGGSDIQAAIDVLSSGLNDIDLRAVGDGTYVFTGSDGSTTTFDLNASALRFDNTSNGFTATDVQGAIEEIQGGSSDDQILALNSPLLEIEDGNSVDLSEFLDNTDQQGLTLNGSILAIENGNTVDLSGLTSGVNTDAQQITDFSFEPASNILTLEIENATAESVDLSALDQPAPDGSETRIADSPTVSVTGSGTAADPYQLASAGGADGSETIIQNTATVMVAGAGTAADPYLLTSAGGADGSETIINNSSTVTVTGTGTTADPYILTSTGGSGGADGSETILNSTATVIVSGTGTAADPYLLESTGGADGSETVIDDSATVTVTGTGTSADPYVLTSTGGTGGADGSETIINSTATVAVTGTGTTGDPYLLESSGGADGSETIINSTGTVTVAGSGTTADPYTLESAGGSDDQIASEVPFSPAGTTESDNVQAAIEELQTDIDGLAGNIANPNDELIDTFELNGTSLDITEAGVPLPSVDLGPVFATDAEVLTAITVSEAADGDRLSDNEIQDLTLEAATNILSITDNPTATPIDLSPYLDDQIAAEVSVTLGPLNYIPASTNVEGHLNGLDQALATLGADPTDELIENFGLNGTSLEITEAGVVLTPVDLDLVFATDAQLSALPIDDADADPENERQDLTLDLSTNTLRITNNVAATPIDLSLYLNNQTAAEVPVALGPLNYLPTSPEVEGHLNGLDQALATLGADPTDELIENFGLNGTSLEITEAGVVLTPVDLDLVFATDAQLSALPIDDADADPENERQDLTLDLSTNTLRITNNVAATPINLSYLVNTDQQTADLVPLNPPLDVDGDLVPETNVQEAIERIVTPIPPTPSLPTANAVQTDALRTYDLNGGNLAFIGSGRIGIGSSLTNPQSKLDVDGQVQSRGGFASTGGTEGNPGYGFYTNGDTNTGMFRAAADQLAFSTGGVEALRINTSQNVGIGTDSPTERLHVNGNILATGTITPDYVFEKYFKGTSELNPNYEFQNLREVYAFIQKNNHLPGVPSAEAVAQQGGVLVNRATEINLEKIEELFLHAIEQEQQIQTLQKEKEILNREVSELKQRLDRIEQAMAQRPKN